MAVDFSKPQKQSAIGIVVVFFYALQKNLRALWPILIISILRINQDQIGFYILGFVAFLSLIAIISYLKFINFTFYIDNERQEFILQEGIFNKTKTSIGLEKIQQINVNQSFIQKFLNVYELSLDTAGSGQKEASIKAITKEVAFLLKAKLLINENFNSKIELTKDAIDTELKIETVNQSTLKIGLMSLVKIGFTANYTRSISIILVLMISIFDNYRQFANNDIIKDVNIESTISRNSSFLTIVIFMIMLLSVVILFNLARTILKYYDLKVSKQDGSMMLSHGLLNSKSTIIKPERVEIVYITQNYFQKKLNVLEIKIEQPAAEQTSKQNASTITIPGCNTDEKEQILKFLFQDLPEKGELLLPNLRKLIFSLFIFVVIPVGLYVIIASLILPLLFDYKNYVTAYAILIPMLQYIKFKNYRIYINDNFIIKQSGLWDITTEIILPEKIQAIKTSQLFWHKRLNIGSFTISTAGGKLDFDLGNYTIIKQKVNLWLYNIEKAKIENL